MDRREVTIEVDDTKMADRATRQELDEFGACMRAVLVADGDTFDVARFSLLRNYGVRVTATRTVFVSSRDS